MRTDGATCGYCSCLPTRHSKKDARYSSDSVGGTSAVGTSESASPEKWKDEDLGWFPNPKGEYTEFSNSILSKFYLPFWMTCPYKERFRRCFVTERKRQWDVCEALKAINHKLAFATSDDPAARRPYPDYSKLPNFHSLSWTETPTFDREPDDFQPRAQIK